MKHFVVHRAARLAATAVVSGFVAIALAVTTAARLLAGAVTTGHSGLERRSVIGTWPRRLLLPAVLLLLAVLPGPLVDARAAASSQTAPVWAWGNNGAGQLGDGIDGTVTSAPVLVSGLSGVTALAAGEAHSLALRSDGTVWAWGANGIGQLGDGTGTPRDTPEQVPGLSGMVAIAAGEDHSLALRSDGTVWAWGYNNYGQLGDGTTTQRNTPEQVPGLSGVIAIAAGQAHSLALRSDGTVWAWGLNFFGQLGDGTDGTTRDTPEQVSGLSGVVAIAAGAGQSLALRSDGTVWAWGYGEDGELGDGTATEQDTPVQVFGLSGVVAIAGGGSHSLALRSDGTVWAWGSNAYGQLGDGTNTEQNTPEQVPGLSGVVAIAAGLHHTLAVRSDGTVWAWGDDTDGEIGDGADDTERDTPVQVLVTGHGGAVLGTGPMASHSLLAQPDLGLSSSAIEFAPTAVGSSSGSRSVTVSNPGQAPVSVSAVKVDGQDSDSFRLTGDTCSAATLPAGGSCQLSVRFIPLAGGPAQASLRISSNTAAGTTVVSLSGAGLPAGTPGLAFPVTPEPIFGTGLNTNGQLGAGGTASRTVPTRMAAGSGLFVAASVGFAHSLGLRADGTVWAWGQNAYDQLGDGTSVDSHTPVPVPTPAGVVAVAAGGYHSLALRSDGTVWAWGSNSSGQLGDGTTTERDTPVQVSGLSGVVAIAAGAYYSLALRSDGTVWAWGSNANGQLGDGTTIHRDTPVQVSGLSGVVAIAAGAFHGLALRSDGTVWAWGYNASGQLGDGTITQRSTPVQVSGLNGVTAIAAGSSHSLALRSDGTVRAWGFNSIGELGDGSTTERTTPVQVSGLSGVTAIAATSSHSLALRSDGTVWGWGGNFYGQLGDGSTNNRTAPVEMTGLGHGGQALATGSLADHSLVIGQPHAALSAKILSFAPKAVGKPSNSLSETVTNDGSVPLTFGQAAITANAGSHDGDEFSITGDGCSDITISPGTSCSIGIRFTPKIAGTPRAILRILSDSPTNPDLVILDPPRRLPTITLGCSPHATRAGQLRLRCTFSRPLHHALHRVKLRLSEYGRTVAEAAFTQRTRAADITLRLPKGLHAGIYTLTATTRQPATHSAEKLRLPHIRP